MSRQALQGHENGDIEYDPELLILVVEDALVSFKHYVLKKWV